MHSNSLKSLSLSGMSTFLFYSKIMKVVIVDSLAKKNSNLKPQIKSSGKGIFSKDNQEEMKYSCIWFLQVVLILWRALEKED